ncbi:hypothetical protein SS50377_27510 [Spironucleus salmonicida]|uniref:Uncharacterized protein n=1 Tax=Spironucleus salmonicida TaxID=348837 RepID=V6LQF1_9EUKA|nr:hypothetical protein SS50377_27510 [Spironucleus salmonicida]|eukprot:EST46897.1 Hypothetical protein SS50377_13050 [Spironucleus salmonicida]
MSFPEFLRTLRRLQQQEKAVTIDLQTTIQHAKHSQKILHFLSQTDRLAAQERASEQLRVSQHLQMLSKQLSIVDTAIKSAPSNLKALLLTTEGNLTAARSGWVQARDALDLRGQSLSDEIEASFRRYEAAERAVRLEKPVLQVARKQIPAKSKILQQISDELERIKYPHGGWTQEQHERFYVQWLNSKTGNRRRFCELLTKKLPEFTIGALLRHDDFCFQVAELLDKKKKEIQKWKVKKELEFSSENQNFDENSQPKSDKKDELKIEKLRAFREQKLMAANDVLSEQLRQKIASLKELKRAKMNAQKAFKQRQIDLEIRKNQQLEIANLAIREQEEALLRRKMGIQTEAEIAKKRQSEKRLKETENEIQRIRILKNEAILQKQADSERIRRLHENARRGAPEAVRDVERLYRPTMAQKQRIEDVKKVKEAKKEGNGRFGDVNVGYDPFAVIPIAGGLKRGGW